MTASDSVQAATYTYVGAIVDELARAGVCSAVICPGSRSAPLAICLAAHPDITHYVHIDERSAAFFALGMAKATGRPAAVICTSGTAAANFLPAVVEARYARVPLLVLTSDRPHELRDNGAPQAIDQIHLYGGNVKWFVEMALPEAGDTAIRYARTTASRAVATALEGPAGPVHLNLPFREPLVPPPGGVPVPPLGRPDGRPYMAMVPRSAATDAAPSPALEECIRDIAAIGRGVIVCGEQRGLAGDTLDHLLCAAEALGWPVLADPLSGVRCGPHDRCCVIDSYDAFLRDQRAADQLAPDVSLRIGAPPVSKALQTFLSRAERQVLVDPDGGWRDPSARADTVLHADLAVLCAALLREADQHPIIDHGWIASWRRANEAARAAIDSYLDDLGELFEGKVFAELSRLLPDGTALFAGNSMPVRDLDTFFPSGPVRIRFLANRGANGIDGVVSSALGAAAGGAPSDGPLVLVIGDLSFYHDLNGLLAAGRFALDATIILLNNDGGGIFSFLPQAAYPEYFEELFGTPLGLDLRPAIQMYGCGYERVETWSAFHAAVSSSLAAPGTQVIEVRTDRQRNVALHRAVTAAVAEAL